MIKSKVRKNIEYLNPNWHRDIISGVYGLQKDLNMKQVDIFIVSS